MAKPIEMLFGFWTQVGQRNHVLDGGPDRPMRKEIRERNWEVRWSLGLSR